MYTVREDLLQSDQQFYDILKYFNEDETGINVNPDLYSGEKALSTEKVIMDYKTNYLIPKLQRLHDNIKRVFKYQNTNLSPELASYLKEVKDNMAQTFKS